MFKILYQFFKPFALWAVVPTLTLQVGQKYPLQGLIAENIKIDAGKVASAKQTPEGTLLIGNTPGSANMTVDSDGKTIPFKIIVRDAIASPNSETNLGRTAPDAWKNASNEIKSLPGIKITKLGEKTLVEGEVLGRKAYQRLLFFTKHFPKQLNLLAVPSPGISESLAEQARMLLADQGFHGVRVSNAGHRFFLEGTVNEPNQIEQALEVAQQVIPNIETHLPVPIRVDPTITIRVSILELSKKAHELLGLSWPQLAQNALILSPSKYLLNPVWAVNLQHLSTSGQAKILAEPMISLKNGSKAEIVAGGEIPIRLTGIYQNKVEWKHYGLRIQVHVVGISGNHIRTQIQTESSQLDDTINVEGIPAIKISNMSTEIDAQESQPILLTGLFQAGMSKDVSKFPLLGNLPLIGELFKSRDFRNQESELLVSLLPTFGEELTTQPLKSGHGLDFDLKWRIAD